MERFFLITLFQDWKHYIVEGPHHFISTANFASSYDCAGLLRFIACHLIFNTCKDKLAAALFTVHIPSLGACSLIVDVITIIELALSITCFKYYWTCFCGFQLRLVLCSSLLYFFKSQAFLKKKKNLKSFIRTPVLIEKLYVMQLCFPIIERAKLQFLVLPITFGFFPMTCTEVNKCFCCKSCAL